MANKELTDRQKEILEFIASFLKDKGYPPTIREICSNFNISSTFGVKRHLEALQKKGYISIDGNASRAIRILNRTFDNSSETFLIDSYKGSEFTDHSQILRIPVLGKIAAGSPMFAEQNIEDIIELPKIRNKVDKNCFALKVKGDSMINAGILENDLVVINPGISPKNGDIVAALIEDTATLKRFFLFTDYIELKPENEYYKSIYLNKNDLFSIIGKAVLVLRTY